MLAVGLISVGITASFRWALPAANAVNESTDYTGHYWPTALKLAAGGGYTTDDGLPASRYPPGYPLLLAAGIRTAQAIGVPIELVNLAVPVLSHALAALLIFLITSRIWGRCGAWLASLVWATYPFSLWLTKQPNSEGPFLVAFYAAFASFWYGVRRKTSSLPFFFSGVLVGLASLIRPIALGIGVVLALAIYLVLQDVSRFRRLLYATLLIGGNILAIAPWEAWVYSKTNDIIPLSTGGVASTMDGLTFPRSGGDRVPIHVPGDVRAYTEELGSQASNFRSPSDVIGVLARDLRDRPHVVVHLFAWKAVRSWYATDSRRYEGAIVWIQIGYLLVIGIAAWRAVRRNYETKALVLTVFLLVGYYWFMTISVLSIVRYMVPAIGLLFLLLPALLPKKCTNTQAA